MTVAGLLLLALAAQVQGQDAGQKPQDQYPQLDAQIEDAVNTGLIPGAVLLIGRNGQILYQKAYGSRSLVPEQEAMTTDTIFDVASLTKVIATTPCIMKLFEQGKIRIDDPVTKYLPEFQGGRSDITVRNLMTHFSGMPPDLVLNPKWSGYETGIRKALIEKPVAAPGQRFIYSDINFLLMGEIVRRLSGKMMPEFARDEIFAPLGMTESQFDPPAALLPRIAPTERDPDTHEPLRGVVHDPTSRYMGGVAGNAGLFTTAADMAKYAEMMLALGSRHGVQIFSPLTVRKFTEPASPADQPILRGLGWDIDSPYSSNRGELYPIGSFGHTGYTGTSLWMDPATNSYVILLTNVVHPNGVKSLSSLRSRVATAVAASFGIDIQGVTLTGYNETIAGAGIHRIVPRQVDTMTGLDVLEENGFAELKNRRIGLITNQTGLDRQGRRNVDTMLQAGIRVVALFSPEHGLAGALDEAVGDAKDAKTGLPVISLYKPERRHLTPEQLESLDAIVFDIQDVGVRFYTYSTTMLYALQDAGKAHKRFYVLDRPNPLTGTHVEGPVLDKDLESFIGPYELPVRHGMTFGELATMANAEQHWGADLHVISMRNWQRGDWFDSTTLTWVNPSPNIRSLTASLLYPGLGMLEANTNYSVGRGTDAPFEQVGADWIDGQALALYLNARLIPGVRAYSTRFTPASSNFAGREIEGVRFVITDRESFDSTRLGIELAVALEKLYPGKIDFLKSRALIGSRQIADELKAGVDAGTIVTQEQEQAAEFDRRRLPYLIYAGSDRR
ncbi:MAG TPA: exo-beta-N-acetylmuramidase NamZ domain-containing protein [Bryobacteraceae bacterium]|nr:exo-beta-N-acetylmuramidase NamZ domain-containing protein [Bryobacteraceae bacterium]